MKMYLLPALLLAAIPCAVVARPAASPAATQAAPLPGTPAWVDAQALALSQRLAKPDWQALPEGVLWRRTKGTGSGIHPTEADVVEVHYEASLVDGTVVDSSYERGEPAAFPLQGLIPAWTLAIPMAGEGDTIEIASPAAFAYGEFGAGPIPGGATLLFKVELLKVLGR